jgi:hypothetical protein
VTMTRTDFREIPKRSGWGETIWRGWLWRASIGDPDPDHLMAYAPIDIYGDLMRRVLHIRNTGRAGPWEIVVYGEVLGSRRTKSEAKALALTLLETL